MIYDRAETMFGQLRDAIGDDAFRRFLRDYYHRWALKHVDELALRASAERASGRDLGRFFDQWVHHVGLTDYAVTDARSDRRADGRWVTRVVIVRRGEYRHPMPVGVRTSSGWTLGRGDGASDRQIVEVVTAERPQEVRLDPLQTTVDWDWRNNQRGSAVLGRSRFVFDWPFLDQSDRERTIVALTPLAWWSDPGGLTVGARARGSYLTWLDRREAGLAVTSRLRGPFGASTGSRVQAWVRVENPYVPFATRPLVGYRAGAAFLDGIAKLDLSREWDISPFFFARGPRLAATAAFTAAYPTDRNFLPELWTDEGIADVTASATLRLPLVGRVVDSVYARLGAIGGLAGGDAASAARGYGRLEAEAHAVAFTDSVTRIAARLFGGWTTPRMPLQRALYASSRDPISTFENHFYRPRGSLLKELSSPVGDVAYLPLGGAGLRGYGPGLPLRTIVSLNVEGSRRLTAPRGSPRGVALWLSAFADVGVGSIDDQPALDPRRETFFDLGPGLSLRGRFYDRDVRIRVDVPVYAYRGGPTPSVVFSFNDLF
jgi:hypothetical protein